MAQRANIIARHVLAASTGPEQPSSPQTDKRMFHNGKLKLTRQPLRPAQASSSKPQVIVITGCTSGLGLHLCREYMRLGHIVAGCGRRADIIQALNAECAKPYSYDLASSFHVVDVSQAAEVAAFAKEVEKTYGDVDVLICNAGIAGKGVLSWDIPEEHLHKIVDVSLKGLMFTNKHFMPIMSKGIDNSPTGGPVKRIINISSGVGHTSMPAFADYCSVKFAVEGWSKCVAQEIKHLGDSTKPHFKDRILCVPLAPGVVQTEMNRNPKAHKAEDWCKDAASFILQIPPSDNGSSLIVPGYYSEEYMAAWIVPSGAKMNDVVKRPA